jgi:biotin carboxylase
MPRLLLLLPTRTYRSHDFMDAAGRLGVYVTVGSDRKQALADLTPGRTLALDFLNMQAATQEIVAFARDFPLDAIIGVDDDTAILGAMAAQALDLPHNGVAAVRATRNKHRLRMLLAQAGLLSPPFSLFSVQTDPFKAARQVPFPCVVKPLCLSASRGVMRADTPEQFVTAFNRLGTLLRTPEVRERGGELARQILVEGFIPGVEVALEGLLLKGELTVLALFDKPDPLDGPFFEETLYITPSRLEAAEQEAVAACTAQAARAIGLHEGPVHAELRVNAYGAWMIEIAARSIGGLCSRTLRFGTGVSLEELILLHAMGADIAAYQRETKAAGVMMIPIPYGGILRGVYGEAEARQVEGIEELDIMIPIGQEVIPLPEGAQYLGFLFARADTPEQVEAALRQAHDHLTFVVEPPASF